MIKLGKEMKNNSIPKKQLSRTLQEPPALDFKNNKVNELIFKTHTTYF